MYATAGWKIKRTAVALLLAFTTATASVGAAPNGAAEGNPSSAATSSSGADNSTASNAPADPSKAAPPANAAPITESQFEELRGLIEAQGEQLKAQQETILALEAALHPGNADPTAAPITSTPAAAASDPAPAVQDQSNQSQTVRAQVPQDW
jgi:hypothetical protein